MAVIKRQPLAGQAVEVLREQIGSGRWALGAKLPGEQALADELGVGRSTVREAIRELAVRGVLESRQGSGVYLLSIDVADDWETVLRKARIGEILEGRIAIEVEAARLAAERRTPHDLRALSRALDEREAAISADDETFLDADQRFHTAVVAASHNTVLVELFASFVPRIRPAMLDMLDVLERRAPHHPGDHEEHRVIVDAIRARDGDAAARASRDHLTELGRGVATAR